MTMTTQVNESTMTTQLNKYTKSRQHLACKCEVRACFIYYILLLVYGSNVVPVGGPNQSQLVGTRSGSEPVITGFRTTKDHRGLVC
jgi:hypothetical protein